MNEGRILLIGRNPAMLALVDQHLKAAGIVGIGHLEETTLLSDLETGATRLLVIGGGVEEELRERLRTECAKRNIAVVEHFGGPSGLVDQIRRALH